MKFVLALLFLAAVAFSTADAYYYAPYYGYWGYPYRYVKPAPPTHETKWVDGYGYAIHPIAKEERKKREAVAEPEPEPEAAILATTHSAPAVPLVYGAIGAPLLPAVPINPTAVHKGSEVIPGAVTAGEPIAAPTVYAGHLGYGLPYHGHGWGYGFGVAHPPVLAAAAAAPAEAPAAVDVRKKREAEGDAEADPWYGYYGHYGYGLGYGYGYGLGYGYGGYYGYPGYGYAYYG